MEPRYRIQEGDSVHVHLAQDQVLLSGTVRYVPQATGDAWIIEKAKGTVYYVQTYEYIERRGDDQETAQ